MADDFLDEKIRAEDIILGALGLDTEFKINSIESTSEGFKGIAKASDGEEIQICNEFPLDELEIWALNILTKGKLDE